MGEGRTSTSSALPVAPIWPARALVVDDNVMNQEGTATILRYAGYEVTVVADAEAAYEAVQNAEFNLVLIDLERPVMGGVEAARRIRELGGRARRIPIMDDFLTKPTGMRRVLQVASQGLYSERVSLNPIVTRVPCPAPDSISIVARRTAASERTTRVPSPSRDGSSPIPTPSSDTEIESCCGERATRTEIVPVSLLGKA
jgi:CheY-like chemotaxis protein